MNKFRISIIALFLLVAAGAALAASNSTQITLPTAITLDGNKLDPGTYTVKWTGEADNLTVSLRSGKKEVTAQAKSIKNDSPLSNTSYVTSPDGQLLEVRPGGKKTSIRFNGAQSASAGSTN
jgi:hypothetical protein